jgi:hypothetical protein
LAGVAITMLVQTGKKKRDGMNHHLLPGEWEKKAKDRLLLKSISGRVFLRGDLNRKRVKAAYEMSGTELAQ